MIEQIEKMKYLICMIAPHSQSKVDGVEAQFSLNQFRILPTQHCKVRVIV